MTTSEKASFPTELAHATRLLAVEGLRHASEFEAMVFSPYAIVKTLMWMYAGLDNKGKVQVAHLLGLRNRVENASAFFSLDQAISGCGFSTVRTLSHAWLAAGGDLPSSVAGLANLDSGTVDVRPNARNLDRVADDIRDVHRQNFLPAGFDTLVLAQESVKDRRFLALNALAFYGEWEKKFYPQLIGRHDFYTNRGQKYVLEYMQRGATFRSYIWPGHKAIDVSLSGDYLRRLRLLLWAPRYHPLIEFRQKLNPDQIIETFNALIDTEEVFYMPRLSISSQLTFDQLLGADKLGVFSGMDAARGMFLHQAQIAFADHGLAVSPQTVPGTRYTGEVVKPKQIFFKDAPFLFFLIDDVTGTILQAGQYPGPEPD